MKIIGVIPTRYKSSRFLGKSLADICGKPMIWWVYQQCQKIQDFEAVEAVYIATDDDTNFGVCKELGLNVIMTSDQRKTGTDQIGEVTRKIPADLIVNIQGNEPILEQETIRATIKPFYKNPKLKITNLMTKIDNPVGAVNFAVQKVITNKDEIGIYPTRATAPYPKSDINYDYYKQVCAYGFKPKALQFYCDYGMKYGKAKVGEVEGIEILRFIENGYKVQYIGVNSDTGAVDVPNDSEKVRAIVAEKNGGNNKGLRKLKEIVFAYALQKEVAA